MPVAWTSRLALAHELPRLSGRRKAVYEAIRDWPGDKGPSIADLAEKIGCKESTVCGRLPELRDRGLIEDGPLKPSPQTQKTVKTYRAIAYRPEPPPVTRFDRRGQGQLFATP